VKVGLAQIDTRIGDFEGNRRRILEAAREAGARGAEFLALPELALTGYPPRDLLFDPAFVERATAVTAEIARDLASGPPTVLGAPWPSGRSTPNHPGLLNAALLLAGGRVYAFRGKRLLPAYDVFHEPRWFVPDDARGPVEVNGMRVGLLVCEDLWDEGYACHPGPALRSEGAALLVAIAASPFRAGILAQRLRHARRVGGLLVYVNAAGANDELVFDGGSFALGSDGALRALLPRFREAVEIVDLEGTRAAGTADPELGSDQELYDALVCGLAGFVAKNGLPRVFLGLSGGVDSALVACIAADAVGPGRVVALALPSRHSDARSTQVARGLAASLGIGFAELSIEPLYLAAQGSLAALLDGSPAAGVTDENLQARLRALVLAAHVNRRGGLLLNTSNKTELSLGYGTLYGDLAGTLSVIGDLTKTEVYSVARWCSAHRHSIPGFILERAPSAELRPGQVDPFDYETLSPLLESLVQGRGASGGPDAERWRLALRAAEHKRFQHGVILKLSETAFGTGRLVPITRAW